jgi:hypothetical protein
MSRKFFLVLLFLILAPGLIWAATTGKIRGKVIDRETGDALPGANVMVVGTTLGAAADVNGEYTILNLPVGVYSVKASFIGYRDVTISNVKISADLTTTVNFELPSEALEVGAIEIVAERPLVNRSATNAVRIATAETFEKLPIRGTIAVYNLVPGVVVQNNNLYIRGGRSDEVGYFIEGANVRNVLDGANTVIIIPEALAEAQIQAGGYNAEYGGANAGIITQTLRSGSNAFHARFQAETDRWPGQGMGEKVFDTYSYGYSDYVLTLSGPIVKNRIKFFVAGENTFLRDSRQVFWTGFNLQKLMKEQFGIDEVTDSGLRGGVLGDPVPEINIIDGNIPDFRNRWSLNSSVNLDYKPLLFRFTLSSVFQRDQLTGARPIREVLVSDRFGLQDLSNNLFTAKLTHLLSNKTFYELNVSFFDRRRKQYDPNFDDNYLLYGDSLAVAKALGPEVSKNYRRVDLGPAPYDVFNFPFSRPGTRRVGYFKEKQNYISANLDFTTQTRQHEIKFGGSFERWTVRRISRIGSETNLQFLRSQPDMARAIRNGPSDPLYEDALFAWRRSSNINAYGYDVFGNEVDSDSDLFDGPKHPTFGAFYVRDKFEAGDLVINAGLRVDFFDFAQRIPRSFENPTFDLDKFDIPQSALVDVESKTEVSPRLGFAFPVTDRTVFHVQYGRFVQAPQFINVFSGRGWQALSFGAGNFLNNPAIAKELDPIVTIQYEIGFSQAMTDFAAFDITAFYRDVKGQLQITKQITEAAATAGSYNYFQNQDFATTKGLELSLTIRRTERVSAFVSYTFSDAQGTASFPNATIGAVELDDPVPTIVSPLDFSQRHRGSISFDYRFGKGDGGPILERLGANLLFTFNSGHPYTRSGGGIAQQGPDEGGILNNTDPRGRRALENIGASTTPWVSNLDLRVDKTISLGPVEANLYFYVQNLLNTKSILNVYQRTGNAEDDGFLSNPDLSADIVNSGGPPYVALYQLINLANRQHWWLNNTGGSAEDLFGTPRQIRFGVSFEY